MDARETTERFTWLSGGPVLRLERLIGLQTARGSSRARAAMLVGFALWLPLLVLSAIDGRALGPPDDGPFLLDLATHVRFLVAVPLWLIGETFANERVGAVVDHLRHSDLLDEAGVRALDVQIGRLRRWSNNRAFEILLIIAIYAETFGPGWSIATHEELAWAGAVTSYHDWTPAGFWMRLLAFPLFQFLLLRWFWRLFMWTFVLARLTRVPFRLVAGHPDRAGGLGVFAESILGFVMFIVGGSAVLGATFTRMALWDHVPLQAFQRPVAVLMVMVLIILLGPLTAFAPKLIELKHAGLLRYSELGTQYVQRFEQRWLIAGEAPATLLGNSDIQSFSDLRNTFEGALRVRIVPFGLDSVVLLAVATLVPMLPLLIVAIPVTELVKMLASGLIKG